MDTKRQLLDLVGSSLWGTRVDLRGQEWSHEQYQTVMTLAREQSVAGMVAQGLVDSGVKLELKDAKDVYSILRNIKKINAIMDNAVTHLCQALNRKGFRHFIFKGQTIAAMYPDATLRQCGDIDFMVHPDDWDQALAYFRKVLPSSVHINHTDKDMQFQVNGVAFEMHYRMTSFAYPGNHKYWEKVVMPEVWNSLTDVRIGETDVRTMDVTYYTLYAFIHIFKHLISDGIGLRHFCDWAVLLTRLTKSSPSLAPLEKHLEELGLKKAFTGVGAVLTDSLGLPKESFPFEITEEDHRRAPRLLENLFDMGNFGVNHEYHEEKGVIHALEHLGRIMQQSRRFYGYAPKEVLWRVPFMFKWWGEKAMRKLKKDVPGVDTSSVG